MSRRSGSRLIKTEDLTVFTTELRPEEVDIPVFSFKGRISSSSSNSAPWFPPTNIILSKWYIAAGELGTSGYTDVRLYIGDTSFDPDGTQWASMLLPYNQYSKEQGITSAGPRYANVASRQWIKVGCSGSAGHRNVTIKIYGRKSG